MTKATISAWETGRHSPGFVELMKISEVTRAPMPGYNELQTAERQAGHADTIARASRRVPVVGTMRFVDDGYCHQLDRSSRGYLEVATADNEAFALRCKGSTMFPAIRDGWFVIVEPGRTIAVGEYVLLELTDGRTAVRELLYERPTDLEVMSVNQAHRQTIDRQDMRVLRAIGPIVPPSAWTQE